MKKVITMTKQDQIEKMWNDREEGLARQKELDWRKAERQMKRKV